MRVPVTLFSSVETVRQMAVGEERLVDVSAIRVDADGNARIDLDAMVLRRNDGRWRPSECVFVNRDRTSGLVVTMCQGARISPRNLDNPGEDRWSMIDWLYQQRGMLGRRQLVASPHRPDPSVAL